MRKNYLKKNLLIVVMVLTASSAMVSCQGFLDAVIGTSDNPTVTSTQTNSSTYSVVKTETGASITANTPSEITVILDQLKSDIEAKGSTGYELVITNKIGAIESDNKVTLPTLSRGAKLTLKLEDGVVANVPLIITTQNAGTESKEATAELVISIPDNSNNPLNLEIALPETSVTLLGANVYEKVVALTANSTLIIGKGIVIREFQALGGLVIMEEGSEIETYVYAPMIGDEPLIISENGVLPRKVKNSSDVLVSTIQNKDGSIPSFMNLRVVKGNADYAEINFLESDPLDNNVLPSKLGKLIVSDGACAFANNANGGSGFRPDIDFIEGEGNAKLYYSHYFNLTKVKQISNISVSKLPSEYFETSLYISNSVDNCSFSSEGFGIISANNSTLNISNSKFEMIHKKYNYAEIPLPAQTESITSFTLTFDNCEFNKDFTLYPRQVTMIHTEDGERTATFHDYVARIVLKNCKYNGYEITKDNINSDQIKEFFKGSPHHLYKSPLKKSTMLNGLTIGLF